MEIRVEFDTSVFDARTKRGNARLAYGTAEAINDTMKLIQGVEFEELERHFEVRRRDFMKREVAKIEHFARPRDGKPFGVVGVGTKSRFILGAFERGGQRPRRFQSVAVPLTGTAARPSFGENVPKPIYYRALRLRSPVASRKGKKHSGPGVKVGLQGTYQVDDVGIFQRDPGEEESTLIYSFQEDVPLDNRLNWISTAKRVTDQWFPVFMKRQLDRAYNERK